MICFPTSDLFDLVRHCGGSEWEIRNVRNVNKKFHATSDVIASEEYYSGLPYNNTSEDSAILLMVILGVASRMYGSHESVGFDE